MVSPKLANTNGGGMLVVKIDKEFIVNDAPERGSGKTRDVVFDESELQRRLGQGLSLGSSTLAPH